MLCLKQLDLALGRGGRNLLKPSESSQRNGVSLFLYHPGHWHTNNIILTHFVLKCSVSPYACCVTFHLTTSLQARPGSMKRRGVPKERCGRIQVNLLHQLRIFSGCKDHTLPWSGKPNAILNFVRKEIKSKNLLQQLKTSNCFYFLIPRSPSLELTCQKAGRE